ncbi:MAG: YiaA/YiaB family inner membrane protein [Pseudomonadota bacterium]
MFEHSKAWINFNYLCVSVAFFMLGASIFLMPVNLATKGYLAMGIVFLSGSLVTLVKTIHDLRIQKEVSSKLERAKQDRLLKEYVENN